jgi:prepilin-type N-terminal cleavage/methylation domain-containing protein
MKTLSSPKGITIIELMVVVVLIGIIAAMAVPKFTQTLNRLRFRTEARNIVSTLRLARSHAVTDKQPYGVHFDNDKRIVTMFLDTENPTLHQFETADSIISVDTLPSEFVYLNTDYGIPSVVYSPNGSASNSGNVYFMTFDSDDNINVGSINILASTGRTKMGDLFYY